MVERERNVDRRADDGAAPVPTSPKEPAAETAHDIEFRRQMEIARQVMRDHRNVLRALAK